MAGEKVHLIKEKETLLITVCGNALESRLPQSLLKDHFADEAVRRPEHAAGMSWFAGLFIRLWKLHSAAARDRQVVEVLVLARLRGRQCP
jgi:O-methyltransferase involved in polyketide biosynthesis